MQRIGIDLGGTKIEGVVLDEGNQVVVRSRVATESAAGYEHIVERVGSIAAELLQLAPDCPMVGIGTPGAVSQRTGRMKNCNTVCLNDRDLPGDLQRCIGRPVRVENDANCFVLAEATCGSAKGAEVVFGVIIGTGVGGGIVCDGKLLRGPQRIAGEWGHHSIDPNGPDCYCGQKGCVEQYISGPAVERQYRRETNETATMTEIVARARGGEAAASSVMAAFIDRFGRALANVVSILDPDVIVLGGGLSNVNRLYANVPRLWAPFVFSDSVSTPLRRAAHGDSGGVRGAAWLWGRPAA